MQDNSSQLRGRTRSALNPSGAGASDETIAELERTMKARLREEPGRGQRAAATKPASPGKGPIFPKADLARQAREAILNIERNEEEESAFGHESDDNWLYVDLEDRFTPADRMFSSAQSWVHFSLRVLAGTLTVIAGCELAYAFDLFAFEAGRNGAILAAVVGCFAAARWITKD